MGMSASAILAYGYDLGGGEEPWKVKGLADEYELITPVLDSTVSGFNLAEQVEGLLLAHVGFTETDYRARGHYERRRAAQDRLPIKVEMYCNIDYAHYLLVAYETTVYWHTAQEIDFRNLEVLRKAESWDPSLARALEVLGIEPVQEKPSWLLSAYYG